MDETQVVLDEESMRLLEELARKENMTAEEILNRLIADFYAKVASHQD